jgi:hypothetical protein
MPLQIHLRLENIENIWSNYGLPTICDIYILTYYASCIVSSYLAVKDFHVFFAVKVICVVQCLLLLQTLLILLTETSLLLL